MSERDLFIAALQKEDPAERSAYLDTACAGDMHLRRRVGLLLGVHDHAGDFLGRPAAEQLAEAFPQTGQHTAAIGLPCEPLEAMPVRADRDAGDETQAEPSDAGLEQALAFLGPPQKDGSLGRLGHYEVLKVVGRGGFGIVLKAFDEQLNRVVAIKVVSPELADSAVARRRFIREAQAAAAVTHPHIVTIHAVEPSQELPYLVMEYVEGVSLQDRLEAAGPLELKEILRIGMQAAEGLAAAHRHGLIHRDVKPANILLENGVQRVKITDFGLARVADDAAVTGSGVIAGTPMYMSPEQAEGETVDHRSDLFSLGSVLYALCTGRSPFRASTAVGVLKKVCEDSPRPIREINPDIPQWLADVITKLHAKKPEDRFPSANEVADLLRQALTDMQSHGGILATPPRAATPTGAGARLSVPALSGRTPRKRRRLVAAVVALFALLTGLSVAEATGVTRFTGTVLHLFSSEGTLVVEIDDPGVSVVIDGEDLVITGAGPKEIRLKPGRYKVEASKDGKVVKQELVTITQNGRQVVRVSRQVPPAAGPGAGPPKAVKGEKAATPRVVTVLHAIRKLDVGGTLHGVQFSPDGKRLLVNCWQPPGWHLIDLASGKQLDRECWTASCSSRFTADGAMIVGALKRGTPGVWDSKTGELKQQFAGHRRQLRSVDCSPDGRFLLIVTGGAGGPVVLWDVKADQEAHTFDGEGRAYFSPDGRQLLGVGQDQISLVLWDLQTRKEVRRFSGHSDRILFMGFSADGKRLYSTALDGSVRVWDAGTGQELRRVRFARNAPPAALSPDGRLVVIADSDKRVRVWNVDNGHELCRYEGHTDTVKGVACSPDGRLLASASVDGTVRLWQVPPVATSAAQDSEFWLARGRTLHQQGKLVEAEVAFRKAVALSPRNACYHDWLGFILLGQGKYDEAIPSLRKAIALNPTYFYAHRNLGHVLRQQGKFADAATAYQSAVSLRPEDGDARYRAAIVASLASCGKGVDAGRLDAAGRASWRSRALAWLRQELLATQMSLVMGMPADRQTALRTLRTMQREKALAGLREPEQIATLSAAEQEACCKLWAEVDALLQKPPQAPDVDRRAAEWVRAVGGKVTFDADGPLSSVKLSGPQKLTDADLGHLTGVKGLSCLWLHQQTWVTDEGLRRVIADHPGLTSLTLGFTGVTAKGLKDLEQLKKLEILGLRDVQLDDSTCRYLGQLTGLQKLYLSRTKLSDAGLTDLARLTNLRLLYLDGTAVTDAGLSRLTGLKNLTSLNLRDTQVTAEAAAMLKKSLPGCTISLSTEAEAQRTALLRTRLPAMLRGEVQPANVQELMAVARQATHGKQEFLATTRLIAKALVEHPEWADQYPEDPPCRYGACCAAKAARGEGVGGAELQAGQRRQLRMQALDWLRSELARQEKRFTDSKESRAAVASFLQRWQTGLWLASVRDQAGLAKLPVEEQRAFQVLWAEVETLQKKAAGK
jgi:serine/threonine protein kinase